MMSTLQDEIGSRARGLAERGTDCVLERFRLPSRPRLTPPAAGIAGAAAAFLLSRGHATASFLLATAGCLLALLDDRGFSPLDWLGPKESRSVLVVRGTPTAGDRRAAFFAVPIVCRLTKERLLSPAESARRALHAAGLCLGVAVCVASAGVLLLLWSVSPRFAAGAGILMLAVPILEAIPRSRPGMVRNRAAGWLERLSEPAEDGHRPFLLLYSGDPEEVKYFLSRHRGELLRGTGIILEDSPSAEGDPHLSLREGPVLPVRVEAKLLDRVRSCAPVGARSRLRETTIRQKSPGLFAMARGFRAVTLFRGEAPAVGEPEYTEREAREWARRIYLRIVSREPGERNPAIDRGPP